MLVMPDTSRAIGADLRRLLKPDQMKDDAATKTAYAVDASIYRMEPRAIALVESEDDIQRVVTYAMSRGVPLTARAAGTNLTGSAIGSGIILDVSRLHRILEVNREERWARVQPGIVLADLNKQLARQGLMFGPDPSSGDMCKLGGMLANNSAGPHTLRYGAVKDNVRSLRVCLSSGSWLDAGNCPSYERMGICSRASGRRSAKTAAGTTSSGWPMAWVMAAWTCRNSLSAAKAH